MRQTSFIVRPKHPQSESNFLSKLTFWYTLKVFKSSRLGNLDINDLTQPLNEHKSSKLGEKFARTWLNELERAKEKKCHPDIVRALYKCFKWQLYGFTVAAFLLEMIVKISQPLFLKVLLRYYSVSNTNMLQSNIDGQENSYTYLIRLFHIYGSTQSPITKGEAVFFTFCLIISSYLNISISHPYLMGIVHLGMKMRIACCSLMYRKALRLRIDKCGGNIVGNIINLLSTDVNRFDNGIMFLPYFWLIPLQITFVTYFLFKEMAFAAVYGIMSLILILPFLIWLAVKVSQLRLNSALKTDDRVRETNEIIQSIQVIKMYTWEKVFSDITTNSRKEEIDLLRKMGYIKGVLMSFIIFSFRFSIFITTIAYVVTHNEITAEKIFVTTAFLLILRQTVTVFLPQLLAQGAELLVSLHRIENFLSLPETSAGKRKSFEPIIDDIKRIQTESGDGHIKLSSASVKFGDEVVLKNINLEATPGSLTVIIGPVGSGKTCLLHLILKELMPFEGRAEINGVISYASQDPWLFSGTVRQNILFGNNFIRSRYEEVCFVCGLITDFQLFPEGDKTFVGEKGAALSGGQRARINLARAIYKRADIYLLDDPLSAVDTNVGQHLFEECITGYLADKIVILVTHQLQYLEDVDQIVLMKNGEIEAIGNYDDLKFAGLDFSALIAEQLVDRSKEQRSSLKLKRSDLHNTLVEISKRSVGTVTFIDKDNLIPPEQRHLREPRPVGSVKFSIYKEYFNAGSDTCGIVIMYSLFVLTQLFASGADFFVSQWIAMENVKNEVKMTTETRQILISIYATIVIVTIILSLIRSIHFFQLCMNASQCLHDTMLQSIMETSMSFFYNNSVGQILNRFSKDLGAVDELLPNALIDTLQIFLNLFGVIIVIGIINYFFLIPTFLMCILFYYMRKCFLLTSSTFKRLEGESRSPVFSHVNATIHGVATIRSHANEKILIDEFDKHQDIHSSAWYMFTATSRSFGYWLDTICIIYLAVISFSFLCINKFNDDGNIGLAITQTLSLTMLFQWGLRQSVEVDNQMVSVERIVEYTKLEPEPNLKSDPIHEPPLDWPSSGKIEFSHTYMKYGIDRHILRDVNFIINDKEKIGIVGRTGAGKSSLIAALFRLAHFYGEVRIDNLDVSQLNLHDLRKKISIIPQEPVLFTGTLQYNLDPFDEYDSEVIFQVLIDLENKSAIEIGRSCLDHMITEGGSNISVGQRQIICLARVLLRNNKIIVMDEATASIDAKTDKFIQSIIRMKFSECTVIIIAHRLHTIMDSDKVLVMDAGKVAEFDHPHILLEKSEGVFASMVQKTGDSMADNLRKIAKENYVKSVMKRDT